MMKASHQTQKKLSYAFSSILVFLLVLTACGGEPEPQTAVEPPESEEEPAAPDEEPVSEEDEIVLQAISNLPTHAEEDSLTAFKEYIDRVNEAALGELKIELIGGPEIIAVPRQMEALGDGVIDMVMTFGAHAPLVPLVQLNPYSRIEPWEEREVGYFDLIDAAHNEVNVKVLGRTTSGVGLYIWSSVHIETLEDLEGLDLGAHAGFAPMLSALNTTHVTMDAGEMYTALERGMVDAVPTTVYGHFLGLHEVVDYILDEPVHSPGTLYSYINLDVFNGLPAHLQELLEDTAADLEYELRDLGREVSADARATIEAEGVEFIRLVEEDRETYQIITHGAMLNAIHERGDIPEDVFWEALELLEVDWYEEYLEERG